MALVFDGSSQMWSSLAAGTGYATALIYGLWRREHTRVWPILALSLIVDIATQVFFASASPAGPGPYLGALLYTVYCTVATVVGIMLRALVEAAAPKKNRTDGNPPPYRV
jgi:hypothetical protein